MRIVILFAVIFMISVGGSGCGFLNDAKVSEGYLRNVAEPLWPDDAAVALVSWPILLPTHAGGLAVSATLDQTVRTFKSTVPASKEIKNYFFKHGTKSDRNWISNNTRVRTRNRPWSLPTP